MPSTVAIVERIYRNQFKCIYLKNQTVFLYILSVFRKRVECYSLSIFKIVHPEKRGYLNA